MCVLLGGEPRDIPVYGSSMRRDISPQDEADRLLRLRDAKGMRAFKVRLGKVCGHNQDEWPGRTEELIPTIRQELGDDIELLADGNSKEILQNWIQSWVQDHPQDPEAILASIQNSKLGLMYQKTEIETRLFPIAQNVDVWKYYVDILSKIYYCFYL